MKKIGLSLSFCVKEIIRGEVRLEDVEKIVAGTTVDDPNDWPKVIDVYKRVQWADNPELGQRIFSELLAAGKIEQPLLTTRCQPIINLGIWVGSESEIQWTEPPAWE